MDFLAEDDFVSPTSEVRRLGRFWISGSLENLERRARREGEFGCRKATAIEFFMALGIAALAVTWAIAVL